MWVRLGDSSRSSPFSPQSPPRSPRLGVSILQKTEDLETEEARSDAASSSYSPGHLIRADLLEKGPCHFAIHDLSHSRRFVFVRGSIITLKVSAPRGRVALPEADLWGQWSLPKEAATCASRHRAVDSHCACTGTTRRWFFPRLRISPVAGRCLCVSHRKMADASSVRRSTTNRCLLQLREPSVSCRK